MLPEIGIILCCAYYILCAIIGLYNEIKRRNNKPPL